MAGIDQKLQHVSVEGYFRAEWTDPRLAQDDPCSLGDIYFDNSLNEWYGAGSLFLYPDGSVYRSVRYNHVLRCPMHFGRLPFDEQQCFVMMASYSADVANINTSAFTNGAIIIPDGYDGTTEWELAKVFGEVTTEWFGVGANRRGYRYVWIYLDLKRRHSAYLLFIFSTCILFSLVAWAGLFINRTIAPARVTIAVIPVLIMLNLQNSVTTMLPPLNYLTWLTSFLFLMTMFSLSVVFEYGLVSFLMHVEAARDRQFEAFKTVASAMKKKADDEDAAVQEHEFHNHEPCKTPLVFPSRDKSEALRGTAGGRPAEATELRSRRSQAFADTDLDPAQKLAKQIAQVYAMFDRDHSGDLGLREVQLGFRKLGQYFSMDQVREIFHRLDVHEDMLVAKDFQRLLLNVHAYMPGKAWTISFWELQPSLQVDIAFRYIYFAGVVTAVVVWLAHW
ncbi:GluClalpha [Symbiodinium natans]|uniref:GluClalpha protein n=1 Tax=Symbiodinium natans TaxID=878477 RepID=A0A812SLL5_9DINO|nr:GluClalpha [Symbiodinium natans]